MKSSGWLLLVLLLFLSLGAAGQSQPDLLTKPAKLGQRTATVEKLLQELQEQSGVTFSYSDDALPMQRSVSLSGNEKTVKEVLDVLFKGSNISYIQRAGQLILKKEVRRTGNNGKQHTISGYIKEEGSGETLIGVTVFVPELQMGTTSNSYGFYSLTLPEDSVQVVYSYVGFKQKTVALFLDRNQTQNIALSAQAVLQEVEIVAAGAQPPVSQTAQMSTIEVPVAQVKDIPALLGEKDVMKVVQLMPGVQKGNEGSSGLYVRGGGPDQNLIILDEAPVYNANHLFGFFSVFNGDAIKSIELTKGGFPARYGGRLSSVLEMNMKEGNKEELHGEAGIGLVSSRLMLEGPIIKNKSSFLISGRRTYIDALITPFMPEEAKGGYYFYDFNAKVNYDFGQKDKLYLSGYFGRDKFYFDNDFDIMKNNLFLRWGNATGTLRWNHLFSDKIFSNTSLILSNYRFNVYNKVTFQDQKFIMDYHSGIQDFGLKHDVEFYLNPDNSLRVGLVTTTHRFTPSALVASDTELNQNIESKKIMYSQETGLYAEHTFKPFPRLMLNTGLRLSHFYAQKKNYFRPEPRISAGYKLTDDLTAKASYAVMNQYVHLLSNTGLGLPTDLWVPATAKVGPQQSQQIAGGFAKDFFGKDVALTLEGYYKKSSNIIGYKEGASFLEVDDPDTEKDEVNWEGKVTNGQGWSYGGELLLQKKTGNFTGWVGYTLSWTQLQFDSLNFGRKFYARYDRRHDVSLVGMYKFSDEVKISATWVYGTGNAITMPLAEYAAPYHSPSPNAGGYPQDGFDMTGLRTVSDYENMNNFRMEAYHRLDVGVQFTKDLEWAKRTWEISVYNIYSRRNPYYYYMGYRSSNLNDPNNQRVIKKVSMFPFIPSISYNLKF
ncbi:MAG: TonB-dependent receptor [Hymenobacteraceae bacterium]|nr:TonB-dependent receptor [Hymenobacteraceae bacterium]MDX5396017.1 TonB-dependent receptor [Hymenobacteraceae bacterium]MDX5512078.1 TonB-dependent receptor [Hymenobacteraceae bacterium]